MRPRERIVTLVAVATGVCMFAGCGGADEADTAAPYRLMDAKAVAQGGEDVIVAGIPVEEIVSVDQRPKGSLLRYAGEGNWRWAGGTDVAMADTSVFEQVVDQLVDRFARKEGWQAEQYTSAGGSPSARLEGRDGDRYVVSAWKKDGVLHIFSFSPCAHLQGDESPHGYW